MITEIGINESTILFTLNLISSNENRISKKINILANTIPEDIEVNLNAPYKKLGKNNISSKQNKITNLEFNLTLEEVPR